MADQRDQLVLVSVGRAARGDVAQGEQGAAGSVGGIDRRALVLEQQAAAVVADTFLFASSAQAHELEIAVNGNADELVVAGAAEQTHGGDVGQLNTPVGVEANDA